MSDASYELVNTNLPVVPAGVPAGVEVHSMITPRGEGGEQPRSSSRAASGDAQPRREVPPLPIGNSERVGRLRNKEEEKPDKYGPISKKPRSLSVRTTPTTRSPVRDSPSTRKKTESKDAKDLKRMASVVTHTAGIAEAQRKEKEIAERAWEHEHTQRMEVESENLELKQSLNNAEGLVNRMFDEAATYEATVRSQMQNLMAEKSALTDAVSQARSQMMQINANVAQHEVIFAEAHERSFEHAEEKRILTESMDYYKQQFEAAKSMCETYFNKGAEIEALYMKALKANEAGSAQFEKTKAYAIEQTRIVMEAKNWVAKLESDLKATNLRAHSEIDALRRRLDKSDKDKETYNLQAVELGRQVKQLTAERQQCNKELENLHISQSKGSLEDKCPFCKEKDQAYNTLKDHFAKEVPALKSEAHDFKLANEDLLSRNSKLSETIEKLEKDIEWWESEVYGQHEGDDEGDDDDEDEEEEEEDEEEEERPRRTLDDLSESAKALKDIKDIEDSGPTRRVPPIKIVVPKEQDHDKELSGGESKHTQIMTKMVETVTILAEKVADNSGNTLIKNPSNWDMPTEELTSWNTRTYLSILARQLALASPKNDNAEYAWIDELLDKSKTYEDFAQGKCPDRYQKLDQMMAQKQLKDGLDREQKMRYEKLDREGLAKTGFPITGRQILFMRIKDVAVEVTKASLEAWDLLRELKWKGDKPEEILHFYYIWMEIKERCDGLGIDMDVDRLREILYEKMEKSRTFEDDIKRYNHAKNFKRSKDQEDFTLQYLEDAIQTYCHQRADKERENARKAMIREQKDGSLSGNKFWKREKRYSKDKKWGRNKHFGGGEPAFANTVEKPRAKAKSSASRAGSARSPAPEKQQRTMEQIKAICYFHQTGECRFKDNPSECSKDHVMMKASEIVLHPMHPNNRGKGGKGDKSKGDGKGKRSGKSSGRSPNGRGRGQGTDPKGGKGKGKATSQDIVCNYCNKKGHKANECRKKAADVAAGKTTPRSKSPSAKGKSSGKGAKGNKDKDKAKDKDKKVTKGKSPSGVHYIIKAVPGQPLKPTDYCIQCCLRFKKEGSCPKKDNGCPYLHLNPDEVNTRNQALRKELKL